MRKKGGREKIGEEEGSATFKVGERGNGRFTRIDVELSLRLFC